MTTYYWISDYNGSVRVLVIVYHKVVIKNPCLDPEFVEIVPTNSFATVDYKLDSGLANLDAHPQFAVLSRPIANHGLCGPLLLAPKYDSEYLP